MLKEPAEDFSAQIEEWSKSVKPTIDGIAKRVKSLG